MSFLIFIPRVVRLDDLSSFMFVQFLGFKMSSDHQHGLISVLSSEILLSLLFSVSRPRFMCTDLARSLRSVNYLILLRHPHHPDSAAAAQSFCLSTQLNCFFDGLVVYLCKFN